MAPLRSTAYLVECIAEVTGQPIEVVTRRLALEHRSPGSTVAAAIAELGLEPHHWSDGLAEFYVNSDAFLYESVTWNRGPFKRDMRAWIGRWLAAHGQCPRRVLVWGDGPGFDSLYLALAGHQVTYVEPGHFSRQFARRLFASWAASAPLVAGEEDIKTASYDAALCLDVLEHVPSPPATIARLAASLADGGCLFVHSPFYSICGTSSTHLAANVRLSGALERLYRPHGLSPVDARLFWNPLVLEKRCCGPWSRPVRTLPGQLIFSAARVWRAPHLLAERLSLLLTRRSLIRWGKAVSAR